MCLAGVMKTSGVTGGRRAICFFCCFFLGGRGHGGGGGLALMIKIFALVNIDIIVTPVPPPPPEISRVIHTRRGGEIIKY